jgi:ligand-binding sensor domain-containing protein/signal transduction histidine kinase
MARQGKPLKRFENIMRDPVSTWLKPGENESATSVFTKRRSLLIVLLFSTFCLLPSAFSLAQNEPGQPSSQPTPTLGPSPSPSPSPTPITGLHQWGAVTLFHGLPSDRVHAIAQDAEGAMWFGTEGGLAKFDGRRTQTIIDPELPGGRVLALKLDSDNALWIGTDNGAARYANGNFQSIKELTGKTVNAIIMPERGRAIMATEQGMIYECRHEFTPPEIEGAIRREAVDRGVSTRQLLAQPLQSADVDHPGLLPLTSLTIAFDKLLVGSMSRGLLEIDRGAAREVQARRPAYFIRALATDTRGLLWVGTKSKKDEPGFYTGDDLAQIAKPETPTGTVQALRPGWQDDMWVGTDGRGVFHFSSSQKIERFTFDGTAGGLRSDHVYSIFIDREQVIWFGTDRGVCRFDLHAPRTESVSENPESNFVRTLYQTAAGQLLCGTNRGLFVHDERSSAWHPVNSLSRNIIYAITEDKRGHLLIGSASGFYTVQANARANLATQTFTRVEAASGNVDAPGSVRAIAQFQGNAYIASFDRGIERVEDSHARLVWPNDESMPREAISIFADGDSRLLIGTTNDGVFTFDGQQTKSDPQFAILKGTAVRSIDRTNDGAVWLATSRGVYLCRQNECKLIAPGLDSRSIVANHSGPSEVWCATTGAGLVKIVLDENLGPVVSQLDVEQGLPSQNVFAVLQRHNDQSDDLLIGTSRGVVHYEPGRVAPSLVPARIISKRVHQPEELRNGLNLEYPQNSLLVDVTATSTRTFPEQFQYAFLLTDGKGKIVRQKLSHESQFAMEGLRPGKYKVSVRAFTKDLVSSSPLQFEFNVAGAPFPWTSTMLAVLLALALLALAWAILEHRRIARTSAALVVANRDLAGARLALADEAERERRRIARDLHDQTLADLRRLLLVADSIPQTSYRTGSSSDRVGIQSKPVDDNGDNAFDRAAFRKEIESVSNEIRRICEDLSPSVLDNVGLAAALEWALANAVAHLPPEKKFEYQVIGGEEIEDRIKLEPSTRIQVYRIAQEVINNICRHADARHVQLSLSVSSEDGFALTIEDDGRSFVPSGASMQGRGLANIHARASLIEAEIAWSEREGGGTVFTLKKVQRAKAIQSSNSINVAPGTGLS